MNIATVDTGKADIAALLQYLQLAILPGDEPQDMEGHWWIAYDGEMPVGFGAMVPSKRWGDTSYLSRSGVLPSYRGMGLQKRLLLARERKARSLNMRWLITDTFENPASSNSLISRGFQLFQPTKPWGFNNALYWRKELT